MSDKLDLMATDFLVTASNVSMEEALLRRLADASNRRKQIVELLESWAEGQAEALLLEWFLKHKKELMATLTISPSVAERLPALPARTGTLSPEEFRESLKCLVES